MGFKNVNINNSLISIIYYNVKRYQNNSGKYFE